MIREVLEKLNEMMCPEARAFADKLKKINGSVQVECQKSGDRFTVDSNVSILDGNITAKDKKNKLVELKLCGNENYKIV